MTTEEVDQVQDQYDRELTAARDSFPQVRIIESRGGYAAVESVVASADTLDGLVRKLRLAGYGNLAVCLTNSRGEVKTQCADRSCPTGLYAGSGDEDDDEDED